MASLDDKLAAIAILEGCRESPPAEVDDAQAEEAIGTALAIAADLIRAAQRLRVSNDANAVERIQRTAKAWAYVTPGGRQARRLALMRSIDRVVKEYGPNVLDDTPFYDAESKSVLVRLMHAWANKSPGLPKTDSGLSGKWNLLSRWMRVEYQEEVSAKQLKKEWTAANAKTKSKRPPR